MKNRGGALKRKSRYLAHFARTKKRCPFLRPAARRDYVLLPAGPQETGPPAGQHQGCLKIMAGIDVGDQNAYRHSTTKPHEHVRLPCHSRILLGTRAAERAIVRRVRYPFRRQTAGLAGDYAHCSGLCNAGCGRLELGCMNQERVAQAGCSGRGWMID